MDKILLVDDSEFFIVLIKSLLDARGCNVLTANNPEEALKVIDEQKPQLVLLDQYMPGMTGDEFCKKIKESPHLIIQDLIMPDMDGFELLQIVRNKNGTKTTPVIVITADNKIETREKVFDLGANDFIVKPIVIEDLIPRVRRFVG